MKLLQVKINGIATNEAKEKVKSEVVEGILKGYIIHDEMVELNVLEFDEIEVTNNGQSN